MDVRVRCCSLTKPAADGSIIGQTVVQNYLNSEEYKLSMEGHLALGYLTHRGRSLETIAPSIGNPAALKKCIGKDDMGLLLGSGSTFTHYVKEFYIDEVPNEGPWLCAVVHILDEKDGFDEEAANNIKRLKALIRSGVKLTCSLVVVAYWDSQTSGIDICRSIKNIKSLDWTACPSFGPLARITEVIDDETIKEDLAKTFSELDNDPVFIKSQPKEGELRVKTFSDISSFGLGDIKKTSKVDGKFTKLKVKEYSSVCTINVDLTGEIKNSPVVEQKFFSAATVNERVRFAKLSPRERFRRLILDYRQALKAHGGVEKVESDTLTVMKSLFAGDVLEIMKTITPLVLQGKNLMTLLNAGALGVQVRKACQAMFIPYKQALMEVSKQGFVSKNRYAKITAAYAEFIRSLQDYVFGAAPIVEEEEEKEQTQEENNK